MRKSFMGAATLALVLFASFYVMPAAEGG